MFLVVFRFSWCNYSLIILCDGKTELESIFGGKLQWLTNSIGVLEISGFGPGWIVRVQMKTFMHRTLGNLMFLDKQSVCTICNRGGGKVINYSECGIQALKRHAASKKHKSDRDLIRTNSSFPSSLQHTADIQSGAATPTRIVCLSEKLMPYGTPQHVRDQIVKDGSAGLECAPQNPAVSLSDRTSHQEALICTFVAENSLPLSVTPKLVELAKELSRDQKALSDVALSRRSATRKLVHGIHNVVRKRLVSAMKTSPFSLNIDESTAKSNKKRVMNVLVCYCRTQQHTCVARRMDSKQK